MYADYYAHTFFDDPKAADQLVEDDEFSVEDVAKQIGFAEPPQVDLPRFERDPGDWEEVGD